MFYKKEVVQLQPDLKPYQNRASPNSSPFLSNTVEDKHSHKLVPRVETPHFGACGIWRLLKLWKIMLREVWLKLWRVNTEVKYYPAPSTCYWFQSTIQSAKTPVFQRLAVMDTKRIALTYKAKTCCLEDQLVLGAQSCKVLPKNDLGWFRGTERLIVFISVIFTRVYVSIWQEPTESNEHEFENSPGFLVMWCANA